MDAGAHLVVLLQGLQVAAQILWAGDERKEDTSRHWCRSTTARASLVLQVFGKQKFDRAGAKRSPCIGEHVIGRPTGFATAGWKPNSERRSLNSIHS